MKCELVLLLNMVLFCLAEGQFRRCQFSYNFKSLGQQAYLRSPNWPGTYPNNADCKYTLTSPQDTVISMNCTQFIVEYSRNCVKDSMTVSLSGDTNLKDGTIICGQGQFSRVSHSNSLVVGFKSDRTTPFSWNPFRFDCLLTIISTAGSPTKSPLVISDSIADSAVPFRFSDGTCFCGTRNEGTRIVGGADSEINEFPWRVAMHNPKMGAFCGGTIISRNFVLLASHCTEPLKGQPLFADIGDHDLTTTTDANNKVIKCKRVIQHERYNNVTQDNDIALCELETPLTYSRTVQPVCLSWKMTNESFKGKVVTASGWGTTTSGGKPSHVLKKVDLPIKTTEECRKYYDESITDNMICTYSSGKDTCQGDSGGSIDYKEPYSGRYFAVGVTSWGVGCAGINQPGVYAKVTNYLKWIESNTRGDTFCR